MRICLIMFMMGFGLLSSGPLFARGAPVHHLRLEGIAPSEVPWLRGALLCYSKETLPPGIVIFEPYTFATDNYGTYNRDWHNEHHPAFWQIVNQNYLSVGITDWLDAFCIPAWGYNRTEGVGSAFFGDFLLGIDIQLFRGRVDNSYPSVKLFLQENFPTGKFDRFDASKLGTQVGGLGSFITAAGVVIGKLIHFTDVYWLNICLQYGYYIPARSHMKGINTFGGMESTNGLFYLGTAHQLDLGFQFTLSQNWAFSCDIVAGYFGKSKFKAANAASFFDTAHQRKFSTVVGSITAYSLAPTIQYSWSATKGAMTSVWFSLPGRNTQAFISWVNAVEFVF